MRTRGGGRRSSYRRSSYRRSGERRAGTYREEQRRRWDEERTQKKLDVTGVRRLGDEPRKERVYTKHDVPEYARKTDSNSRYYFYRQRGYSDSDAWREIAHEERRADPHPQAREWPRVDDNQPRAARDQERTGEFRRDERLEHIRRVHNRQIEQRKRQEGSNYWGPDR